MTEKFDVLAGGKFGSEGRFFGQLLETFSEDDSEPIGAVLDSWFKENILDDYEYNLFVGKYFFIQFS